MPENKNKLYKLLLVEDDIAFAELLREYLEKHGFEVTLLNRGAKVVETVTSLKPDLVILDVMLPDMNGLDISKNLRLFWRGPILMLTALKDDADVVVGLEMGADEYVGKPVSPRVLLARIRALLRRGGLDEESEIIKRSNIIIDVPARKVSVNNKKVNLTTTEFDLLVLLARKAGKVQSRTSLVESLRGIDFMSFDRSVDVLISRLRRKLIKVGAGKDIIMTIRGVGYMMIVADN